jgi:transcription antitermination factor NusG
MPILAAESDFYPENLWEDSSSASGDPASGQWWCLHTKPRQEKAVARDLRGAKVGFYLPQVNNVSRTPQGRKVNSVLPLFAGYVFLRGDETDRMHAIRGNRLVRVLEIFDQKAVDLDLRRIHTFLSSGLPVFAEARVLPGMAVKIKSGPLAGLEGTVVRRGNGDHFVAMVQFLSRGASVELQDWQVEPKAE